MQALIDMFTGFFDAIGKIIDFIIDFFADLVFVIATLGQFVLEIPGYFVWLPGEIIALIITIFSIVVIYMILGRK